MLTSDKERKICEKYSSRGDDGKVKCRACPLNKGNFMMWDFRCKAWCHYDRKSREWVPDETPISEDDAISLLVNVLHEYKGRGLYEKMRLNDAVSRAIECLKRRKPARPIIGKMTFPSGEYVLEIRCPTCRKHIVSFASDSGEWFSGEKVNVCSNCGQYIDWSGVDETVRKYSYS